MDMGAVDGAGMSTEEGVTGKGDPQADDGGVAKPALTRKRLKRYFAKDFAGSSWTIAIQWFGARNKIETTKVALKEDGSVVWLNRAKGTWKLHTRSRTLCFYRDFFLGWNGKRIYAARLTHNHGDMYLEGDIKGWGPFFSLDTMGTFQAVRRGITIDENTPRPPWESRPLPAKGAKQINVPVELD
ncbi:unnamed protein product [Discosporangium mesarthrocarpum]